MSQLTRLSMLLALCLSLFITGCDSPTSEPKIQLLSSEESVKLLSSATNVQPIGEAVVNEVTNDGGTTITTTQLFGFRTDDGTGGTIGTSCSGSCKMIGGTGDFSGCITSGCMPTKQGGCTALKCSGSCSLSSACSPAGTNMTVFGW